MDCSRILLPHRRALPLIAMMLASILASSPPVRAQDGGGDVAVSVGGLVQAETSYGWLAPRESTIEARNRVGFGLRRARLRVNAALGPRAGAFFHVDGDNGTFGVLDVVAHYDVTPEVRLRIGRFAGAQPRAFIPTPVMAMDANERAAIALLWNGMTLGNKGRDFGIDVTYRASQAVASFFVHNGYGSFDRVRGNYQESLVGDATGGSEIEFSDLAYSFAAAVTPASLPGFEIGGFLGYNGSRNPNTAVQGRGRSYVSYSAHAYLGALPGSRPLRVKADVIGIMYEDIPIRSSQHALGLSLLGAVAMNRASEVFGRLESFEPDLDLDGLRSVFLTAGINYSISRLRGRPFPQERLTLAYGARIPESDDLPVQNLLILQAQLNF